MLYKLQIEVTSEIHWLPVEQTNPISQSMCMLGTIDMIEQDCPDAVVKADVLLYAGESADSQVLSVSFLQNTYTNPLKFIVCFIIDTNQASVTSPLYCYRTYCTTNINKSCATN